MVTAAKAKTASKSKATEEVEEVDAETTETPVKAKAKAKAKPATPRKSRAKSANPPRAKLYWGVYNQNYKRVAVFEYENKKDAEKHAKDLCKNGTEHVVIRFKEVIE